MKRYGREKSTGSLFVRCMLILAVFVLGGIIASFRIPAGEIADGAELMSAITFEEAEFSDCFKRAVCFDLVFCITAFLLGGAFPVSYLTGGYIIVKGFLSGTVLGIAARCLTYKKAAGVIFAVFVSNILVMPLYILLFLVSVRFSQKTCGLSPVEKTTKLVSFGIRVTVFFALMCLAEFLQTGAGLLVLK